MAVLVDHYTVLGISTTEGLNLTAEETSKVFKKMALKIHPDKNPNNPKAQINFQQLLSSYEILKNPISRKEFHDKLYEQRLRNQQSSNKRTYVFREPSKKPPKTTSDFKRRKQASTSTPPDWLRLNKWAEDNSNLFKYFDNPTPYARL